MKKSKEKPQAHYKFEGHIEFFGYSAEAEGWFVGGWVAHPWPVGCRPANAVAIFSNGQTGAEEHALFHRRDDVEGRGIGYMFFLTGPVISEAQFRSLRILSGEHSYTLLPDQGVLALADSELIAHVERQLGGNRSPTWQELVRGRPAKQHVVQGYIDFYGYHALADGWLLSGWTSQALKISSPPLHVVLSFETGDVGGDAIIVVYPKSDLPQGAGAFTCFLPSAPGLSTLCVVNFAMGDESVNLYPASSTLQLCENDWAAKLGAELKLAVPVAQRNYLSALLGRRAFTGDHTLATLSVPVFIEIDEAISCGVDGLLLMGWLLAKPDDVKAIRLRSGHLVTLLDLSRCIRLDRPDVLEEFSAKGFDDVRCGFITYMPGCATPGCQVYFEVETPNGELGYRPVPPSHLQGLTAIKRVLSSVNVRFGEVQPAFDHVLGPAIAAVHKRHLAPRPHVTMIDYGQLPPAPNHSIVIPLYGRLDFIEYQMAIFSADKNAADIEFIYVLDEPEKCQQVQLLAAAVYERCLISFRLLLLDRNMGFAPACNIGLSKARGRTVAFLNSDVFPGTPDWLPRLEERLIADPKLGVVAPYLLYEDGSIQHRGMRFERLAEFGDWHFGQHIGKGLHHIRPKKSRHAVTERCISLTGACLVLPRALAERVGGFDETYIIGDFEDSDLCLKVQALGYHCAVDPDVALYHLERQSQASSDVAWRHNLTIYNAWQHERRWGSKIAQLQSATPSS